MSSKYYIIIEDGYNVLFYLRCGHIVMSLNFYLNVTTEKSGNF